MEKGQDTRLIQTMIAKFVEYDDTILIQEVSCFLEMYADVFRTNYHDVSNFL